MLACVRAMTLCVFVCSTDKIQEFANLLPVSVDCVCVRLCGVCVQVLCLCVHVCIRMCVCMLRLCLFLVLVTSKALSQFTANVRRSLLKVMVLSNQMEQEETVIIKECDEVRV